MKYLLLVCAGLLFLALANLPIGYYTLLRIVVTIGAIAVVVVEIENRNEINFWVVIFGLIAILFNPFIPIYLKDKSIWMLIDLVTGILFTIKSFTKKIKTDE